MSRSFRKPFLLVFFHLASRAEGEPEAPASTSPSPSDTPHPCTVIDPQWVIAALPSLVPDPAWQRWSPATPRRPGRHHARHGHPAWAALHRPPSEPSLRHQPCLDPTDQFPGSVLLERDRTPRPDHARLISPGRPERAVHTSRSRALAARPAPLGAHTCTASSPRRHPTLARHCHAPTRSHHPPFHP
jgi:hypothetical protein